MTSKWHPWLLPACLWVGLITGCGSPATFSVETVVHPDGSCDRTTWQPKDEFLPDEALKPEWIAALRQPQQPAVPVLPEETFKPEWIARWKSVVDAGGPPGSSPSGASAGQNKYFIARGSFRSPRDIPPHYRYVAENVPEAGASELQRTYERKDYGFVVEHRWSETITNIVTLPGFLEARGELLDLVLPLAIEFIEKEFGRTYDVSGLATYIRTDVRRFLEDGSLILYDAAVRHRLTRADNTMDPELESRLTALCKRIGFDFPDAKRAMVSNVDSERLFKDFLRRVVMKHVRHRDGTAVTRVEVDDLIERAKKDPNFLKLDERLGKQLEQRAGLLFVRMMGLYDVPLAFLFRGTPQYEFALRLPGKLIETSGTVLGTGQTCWKFAGDQMFPDGYEMTARSFDFDREGQKKVLGRVAIDDAAKALEFLELIGDDEPLLTAVRKARETGKPDDLSEGKGLSYDQRQRARQLRKMLFNE